MEEAVAPIVEQVLQDPPVESEVPAAMTTEEPSTTAPAAAADPAAEAAPPAETPPATAIAAAPPAAADATEQPAPETAVEAADGDAAKPAATSTPADAEGEAKPAATETAPAKEGEVPPPKKPKRKETRKRVRRVGKAEPRKFVKIDPSTTAAAAGEAAAVDAAARPDGAPMPTRRVLSKHDEKWNNMFDRLLEYKVSPATKRLSLFTTCHYSQSIDSFIFLPCRKQTITLSYPNATTMILVLDDGFTTNAWSTGSTSNRVSIES